MENCGSGIDGKLYVHSSRFYLYLLCCGLVGAYSAETRAKEVAWAVADTCEVAHEGEDV